MTLFVIDGYNALQWLGLLEAVDKREITLEQAREELFKELEVKPLLKEYDLKIFFDGDDLRSEVVRKPGGEEWEIVFCKDADRAIIELIRKRDKREEIVVITADAELREEVYSLGEVYSLKVEEYHPKEFFSQESQPEEVPEVCESKGVPLGVFFPKDFHLKEARKE